MKQNSLVILLLLICCILQIHGQKKNIIHIDLGSGFSSFQDVKYSNVRYNGFGLYYGLGYQKESQKAIWGLNYQQLSTTEKPKTHSKTESETTHLNIQAKYLCNIKNNLYIGATWDILEKYDKKFKNLGNNAQYGSYRSSIWLSGIYDYKKFRFSLDIGMISYVKELSSFGFSAPQTLLENGEWSYQNLEDRFELLNFKDYNLRTITKNFQLRTNIRYQLSKRFSVGYQWDFRKLAEVKNYPVTYGIHTLSIRYNILNKIK